jgi:hypothetical protein
MNFVDGQADLSTSIEAETSPDAVLKGHEGFGLVRIQVKEIKRICGDAVQILRDPTEDDPSHVVVRGRITKKMARQIKLAAEWVGERKPRLIYPPN